MERFVVGTGRCGSTLLSKMLAVSPEMTSIFEFMNGLPGDKRFSEEPMSGADFWEIISMPHPFVTMVTSRGYRVEEVAYPFDRPGTRFSARDDIPWLLVATLPRLTDDPDRLFDETKAFVTGQPTQSVARHYCQVFDWFAQRDGKRIWNERSGSGIGYMRDLAQMFPKARFVHLHRSGEEAALSMREHAAFRLAISIVYELDPEVDLATALTSVTPDPDRDDPIARMLERRPEAEHFGRFWSDQLASGYTGVKDLRPEQYLEVGFEDLISDPAGTLGQIARFFDMDPEVDDWRKRAAAMVRGMPPSRVQDLSPHERRRLSESCRTGNQLLERPVEGLPNIPDAEGERRRIQDAERQAGD